MPRVLGIAVDSATLAAWTSWLAPAVQPFFVESASEWPRGVEADHAMTPELRDTYAAWRVDASLERVWLDEAAFMAMPRAERARLVRAQVVHRRGAVPTVRAWSDLVDPSVLRAQADGHRFVWWPSIVATNATAILSRAVARTGSGLERDPLPSRHADVGNVTWNRCSAALPRVRRLAGTFASGGGPNCFGAVMGAAGVGNGEWESQESFEAWLSSSCRRGGDDHEPGTVLVWRNRAGLPVHAAVTIGDGFAFETASQEWWTPSAVLDVADMLRANRSTGQRLERHRIQIKSVEA